MKKEEIIETLKSHYPRDVRKQLVKAILEHEKSNDKIALESSYKMINQIFSYVLQESKWKIGENSEKWNVLPLEIMENTFPQLSTTQWYQEQNIISSQAIDVVLTNDKA